MSDSIFKQYDYVSVKLVNLKDKIEKEYQGFINTNSLDKEIEEALIKGKYSKEKNEIKYKKDSKTLTLVILKHKKTDPIFHSLFEENAKLLDKNELLEKNIEYLNKEIDNLKKNISDNEHIFKKQVVELQEKAQQQINEHRKKNDEHIANELKESKQYALQSFLEDLIQPLNNFDIAIKAAENIDNAIVQNFAKGFEMLYLQIENVLSSFGISKIIPKVGEAFDANIHQVYELVASDFDKDTILEVKNIGYKLHDRTIKPALVIVSK